MRAALPLPMPFPHPTHPMKRAIQRFIQNPLAVAVLEGRFGEGDHIVVEPGPTGQLVFEKADSKVGVGMG